MQITGDDGAFRADHHAGRFQPYLDAVRAVVALGGGMRIGVDVQRVVGAGLHTRFAADAALRVEINDAIRALEQGFRGANRHAGSIVAVVTAIDQKITARVGELTLLDILHPRSIDPDGHIMFRLARHRTGMAADTFALVDHKGVPGHTCFSSSSS